MRSRGRDDEGSILPLVAGYGALALLVVLLVTAATSLYLERKRLLTLADGAALAGAEAYELTDLTVAPSGAISRPPLDDAAVRAVVEQYLAEAPVQGFEGLQLERAESEDGSSATVRLSSFWRPPVVTPFVPEGIRLDVTTVGRSVLG
ncbi:pilus assembly protein TadG-related protein [Microcella daejeonensis]|uniref:Pilus assembly protein TadG-related protein n=1 Tax=Microcella daejeonensis TaxID=2994971 RepID=A0A9E8MNT6_9MICO|nr:pilus assembly protein TadG-related protein [Microcella daejeonensis]WAB82754.1 pilus assembly protein TadG-related protein [Microcella daejeonensis]